MVLTFYNYDFVENKNYFNLDNDLLYTYTHTHTSSYVVMSTTTSIVWSKE